MKDVIVTKRLFYLGFYELRAMEVCVYCEVPPETVERRANVLNPQHGVLKWTLSRSADPNKAPSRCDHDSTRVHLVLMPEEPEAETGSTK